MAIAAVFAAGKEAKSAKTAAPAHGVKTPGVLIPYTTLKSDAEIVLDAPPAGFLFTDAIQIAGAGGIRRFDAATNKPFEPSRDIKGVDKPCGGLLNAFSFVWTPSCATSTLAKLEMRPVTRPGGGRGGGRGPGGGGGGRPPADAPKPDAPKPDAPNPEMAKPEAPKPDAAKAEPPPAPRPFPPPAPPAPPVFIGVGSAPVAATALAASDDSVWMLSDAKTSLLRVDPTTNEIVAEMRLPTACSSILSAEKALWVTCPSENRVIRIEPKTNLVEKRIEVAAEPVSVAFGEGSIWVLGRKEGKISRIDPKTNKVTATIDLSIPNADGTLAFGEGFLWASAPGFPVMRITPANDKVAQQFHGEGGGIIHFGLGSIWVASAKSGTVTRFDPKRILATLAE